MSDGAIPRNRRDKGKIDSLSKPQPRLNDTEFGHQVSVAVRKNKNKTST